MHYTAYSESFKTEASVQSGVSEAMKFPLRLKLQFNLLQDFISSHHVENYEMSENSLFAGEQSSDIMYTERNHQILIIQMITTKGQTHDLHRPQGG